ncbi:MAG: hypothetical protein QM756_24255 [Polyangiaceae bacterium]
MASARSLGAVLVLTLLSACKTQANVDLRDSEGRVFSARCSGDISTCALTRREGGAGSPTPKLRASGRYIGVCDSEHPADCRLITCQGDDGCPASGRAAHGACVGGLCVDPLHEIDENDSVMSCLAGTGVGHSEPRQVERYALGLNCGKPCSIPAPCQRR